MVSNLCAMISLHSDKILSYSLELLHNGEACLPMAEGFKRISRSHYNEREGNQYAKDCKGRYACVKTNLKRTFRAEVSCGDCSCASCRGK